MNPNASNESTEEVADIGAGPTWLIVPPTIELPAAWSARTITVRLLALAPTEVAELIERKGTQRDRDPPFLQLVARGLPARDIARRLRITDRSVYRRLAGLRDEFEVETNAELAAVLARQGF